MNGVLPDTNLSIPTVAVNGEPVPSGGLSERIDNIRKKSMIELVAKTIGKQLVGRVVSFGVGAVVGGLKGMAFCGVAIGLAGLVNEAEVGYFVPREELDGLSTWQFSILLGGAVGAWFGGWMNFANNPYGDEMGEVGALTGRAIVSGLESLDDLVRRTYQASSSMFGP